MEGVILGGGASVYYSHALQLLFFGYSQGEYEISAPYVTSVFSSGNLVSQLC